MSDTTHLALPYLEAAQAQKHVTMNEALALLDALVQLSVVTRGLAVPPATPVEGARYLVASAPTGLWSGQTGKLAIFLAGSWHFATPKEGWSAWIADEDANFLFNGTSWVGAGIPTQLQNLQLVGVNALADTTNKLAVSAQATLFNHAGNGHQLKLNKNAAGDTASLLWQTGFSGRAEIGTTGDDAFHFKVSSDGNSFLDMLVLDATAGRLNAPLGLVLESQATPPAPVNGQMWLDATTNKLHFREQGTTRSLAAQAAGPSLGVVAARHLLNN